MARMAAQQDAAQAAFLENASESDSGSPTTRTQPEGAGNYHLKDNQF